MSAPTLSDARDADGLTPLHLAVVHGNVPLVQTLLAAGADVNARDDEHHTVVHWATVCGEVGALRAVLAAGADAATPDQHGGYPLHYAAQMCGAPAATDHQSRGAALEVLRALVKEGGASVDVRDADGRTPLLWAASAGSAAAVLALHQAGSKVDDADRDGLTALHCAAARGHTEALETLVGLCGARVDVADSHGCTPLHYAAALGHADATSTLLQHGADSHRQDRRGRSPAHTAAAKGQIETVRILGARGANLWLRNSKGDLPLHEAVASGRRELVKWLLDGRPSQVNATNHEGRTPLHIAAATDNADLCRLLLDRGADVNPVSRSSKNDPLTPLDCATARGHRSTAKYLQMHGGLPASKLANTDIVIDGAAITGLPTRRVTSTKIDVHDKIRIEKREIIELSSPILPTRRLKDRSDSDTSNTSTENNKKTLRKKSESNKNADKHKERRKRLMYTQKSFSDGYDTEFDGYERQHSRERRHGRSKKNRSRSEPSRRHKRSPKHDRRYRSRSNSTTDSDEYTKKSKHKRHHKCSKQKSRSTSESSSSESTERRSTKRKGKKTSIHIENDEEKQSVNIIKYKGLDKSQSNVISDNAVSENEAKTDVVKSEMDKDESKLVKPVIQSETETDTLSVKTNMVITEAQIHMERQTSQHNNSEINVTMDSANNVSIETSNLSVTHKDLTDKDKTGAESLDHQSDNKESLEDHAAEIAETKDNKMVPHTSDDEKEKHDENKKEKLDEKEQFIDSNKMHSLQENSEINKQSESEMKAHTPDSQDNILKLETNMIEASKQLNTEVSSEVDHETQPVLNTNMEQKRRKSFQVLSGPDETLIQSKDISSELKTSLDIPSIEQTETQEKSSSPSVSFSNKDEFIESSKIKIDHLMGESVEHSLDLETDNQVQNSIFQKESNDSNDLNSNEKRAEYASAIGSSTEDMPNLGKGLVSVLDDDIDSSECGVKDVILENTSGEYDVKLPLSQTPNRTRKTSKENLSNSRRNSIYETESYKVLSDITSTTDVTPGILKKTSIKQSEGYMPDDIDLGDKLSKDGSYIEKVPSISDNELYSHSEINGRRKRFRKKGRTKSRIAIRSRSENSERGYESSGLMDSGFEPSPRAVQRQITSPRLAAYYQQRNAIGRYSGKSDSRIPVRKPGDKYAVDMKSVTQRIQTNMRRYYCERKIFQHLLELKRLQIRTSKTNEAVLVKRAIEEYNKSSLAHVGLGPYNSPDFSFSSFEKFLYESLRNLQKSGKKHLDKLPERPVEFDYGESDLYKMSAIPDNPCLCTSKTHRCFHAVHAYTGIPCSAYIPYKWDHHTMPKPATAGSTKKSKGFLPKISSKPPAGTAKAHVTLEVSHGTEKQLIALPAEKLDKNKRYYVTFTVKGSEPTSDNDNSSPNAPLKSKNVRSG